MANTQLGSGKRHTREDQGWMATGEKQLWPWVLSAEPSHSSPSEVKAKVSLVLQLSNMSHRRTVLSQEALARMDFIGLKQRPLMGPSWPDRTYRGRGGKGWGADAGCNEGVWEAPKGQAEPCHPLLLLLAPWRSGPGSAPRPEAPPLHCFCKAERSDSPAHLPPSTLSPWPRGPARSYIKKPACLHGPHKDLEGVLRPCRDDFST